MYRLKIFNDPFFIDLFNNISETPNFIERSLKRTNVIENESDYLIEVAVPGLIKEDITIKVKDSVLSISHEKEKTDDVFYFTNSFSKKYTLPDNVNVKEITASVENGVLSIVIPKDKKKIIERVIEIK